MKLNHLMPVLPLYETIKLFGEVDKIGQLTMASVIDDNLGSYDVRALEVKNGTLNITLSCSKEELGKALEKAREERWER